MLHRETARLELKKQQQKTISDIKYLQWNPSIVATIGGTKFYLYRRVALSRGVKSAFGTQQSGLVEGCPHVRGGL